MLDKYLANPPNITEKLRISQSPKKTAEVVADKRNEMEAFLHKWQASWEKKE